MPGIFSAGALREDAALLRRAYEALHPGLRRYLSPAELDAAFAQLDAELARDRTLAQAYLAFSRFAAKVRCGHTYASFFNQSRRNAAALFDGPRLPLEFRWIDGRIVLTHSYVEDARLRPGTTVIAINGIPAERILAELLTVTRADGSNDDKRRALLELRGTDPIETFDVFFPLLFPTDAPDYTLRVLPAGAPATEPPVELSIPAMTAAQKEALRTARHPPRAEGAAFEFSMPGPRTGMLRMPDWVLYKTKWDWQGALREHFQTLVNARATDLIIDLRGNEGGTDVGDVLAAHLAAQPIQRPRIERRTRYRAIPPDLRPYLDTWDRSFDDWGAAATPAADGFFTLRRDADDDPGGIIEPREPHFGGRVWVIVGPENSSATFEFARLVKTRGLGTLVGRPTGGNQRGINGGCFYFLRLPNSGIELDLPLIGQFPLDPVPDAGIQPDLRIEPSAEDIAAGRDPELSAILARIRTLGPPASAAPAGGPAAGARTPAPSAP